jgi:hypothetical protein
MGEGAQGRRKRTLFTLVATFSRLIGGFNRIVSQSR